MPSDLSSLNPSEIAVFDIETEYIPVEGLKGIQKLFCLNIRPANEERVRRFTYLYNSTAVGNLKAGLKYLNSFKYGSGHNIIGFDIPVIEYLIGEVTCYPLDTMLISQLMYTADELTQMDRGIENFPKNDYGSFSLRAFGYRFGDFKIEYEDFSKLSNEMLTYCDQDVDLTHRLLTFLLKQEHFPKAKVIHLENRVAQIIQKQTENGFYFNIEKAREVSTEMKFEQMSIERRLQKTFRPMFLPDGPVKETNRIIRRKQYVPIENFKGW